MTLRIGTRGSALATAQARTVADAVAGVTGEQVELVEIATTGDRSAAPVARLGVGVFVSALRDALLAKEIDLAVHSYKDLPTAAEERLTLAAVPVREDPRDALISRDDRPLSDLPAGARIGTGAPRRMAQLRALGRGLVAVPVRGNVDTRLRKVTSGELDAVMVARAGLARLGRTGEITQTLPPDVMLPAPAQGALAVECRADSPELVSTLAALDDPPTRAAVTAERALLAALEAGCSAPVAGLAEPVGPGELRLTGAVFHPEGEQTIRLVRTAAPAAAEELGGRLAAALFEAGAADLLTVGVPTDPWQAGGDGPAGGDRPDAPAGGSTGVAGHGVGNDVEQVTAGRTGGGVRGTDGKQSTRSDDDSNP